MKYSKPPFLLSFFAISNESHLLVQGQLAYTIINDFSFREFSRRKTIKSLINLYRTESLKNQEVSVHFNYGVYKSKTDNYGSFQLVIPNEGQISSLKSITLAGEVEVVLIKMLYSRDVQYIRSSHILISDIDDTLLKSFIRNKFKKIRTMLFTRMEKRKAVEDIKKIITLAASRGTAIFYLSNSEQNLYPLISSFLRHNEFPYGPVFLKHLRKLMDLIFNRKNPKGATHKLNTLKQLIAIFSSKKFILIGDDTQKDLQIYTLIAKEFPDQVDRIIIRKVRSQAKNKSRLQRIREYLRRRDISLHYARTFEEVPTSSVEPREMPVLDAK